MPGNVPLDALLRAILADLKETKPYCFGYAPTVSHLDAILFADRNGVAPAPSFGSPDFGSNVTPSATDYQIVLHPAFKSLYDIKHNFLPRIPVSLKPFIVVEVINNEIVVSYNSDQVLGKVKSERLDNRLRDLIMARSRHCDLKGSVEYTMLTIEKENDTVYFYHERDGEIDHFDKMGAPWIAQMKAEFSNLPLPGEQSAPTPTVFDRLYSAVKFW